MREYRILHDELCGNQTPIFQGILWAIRSRELCVVVNPNATCEIAVREVGEWRRTGQNFN